MQDLAEKAGADILARIRQVIGQRDGFLPLHEPEFKGNEWQYVKECLDTGWVSSVGSYVDRFEQDLAAACGVRHAIAVCNGTAALHLALQVAGVKAADEVLVPSLSFVATANAVTYCGAVPHFLDSVATDLGLDLSALAQWLTTNTQQQDGDCINRETGRRIAALVPMHTFGHIGDMQALTELADAHNIILVEDAAEALGSYWHGRHAGSFGRISALSFNGNKILTTGGGGAILTNCSALAKTAKHLATTAKTPHPYEFHHDAIGYNYRLPNLNAALGCAQLEQLPQRIAQKRALAARYAAAFDGCVYADFVEEPAHCQSNYWLNAICLKPAFADGSVRAAVLTFLNANNVMARPIWQLLSRQKIYQDCPSRDLPHALDLQNRLINIPSSAFLGAETPGAE